MYTHLLADGEVFRVGNLTFRFRVHGKYWFVIFG